MASQIFITKQYFDKYMTERVCGSRGVSQTSSKFSSNTTVFDKLWSKQSDHVQILL